MTASRVSLANPTSALTFHARNIPTISLESYLLRILKYCPTTNEVFLSLLVYFDRMSKLAGDATGRTFVIDSFNVHRLVIAGVTVASKFFSDVFYTNSRYAKVGGLPQPELNQLELQFLLLNDFRLVISQEEMQRY
ncbi:cyclin-related 2, partial [Athelia psychrophila]